MTTRAPSGRRPCDNSSRRVSRRPSICVAAWPRGAPRTCRSLAAEPKAEEQPMSDLQAASTPHPKVVIYLTGWCPYCTRAKQLLMSKGVAFEEIDVDARPGGGGEWRTGGGRARD